MDFTLFIEVSPDGTASIRSLSGGVCGTYDTEAIAMFNLTGALPQS
jgi:hypothetical protein